MKTKNYKTVIAIQFHIKGRVQGVGFRPFIYRIAKELGLKGNILNQSDDIIIKAQGTASIISKFRERLFSIKPHAAEIKEINEKPIDVENRIDFIILPSTQVGTIITEICPDIAVCPECIEELQNTDRRKNYPFNNCTNCGPRFTIVSDFPYDRVRTSMNKFEMCPQCANEYSDPSNRRFHAQPVSCQNCGPLYSYSKNGKHINNNILAVIQTAEEINQGKVVAIKGLGGYNLACNAFNDKAVKELRHFKNREKKPFAVMFHSIHDIEAIALLNKTEREIIQTWQKPIVILTLKQKDKISAEITSGLPTIGAFLPYLPLHIILFEQLKTNAIVLTSGNEQDTPILFNDEEASKAFRNISGGILSNNRDIIRRIDDSVIRIIGDSPVIFRRARGYVPSPTDLNLYVDGILAVGAELSNCFCIGKEKQAIMSQHIGDLQNIETYEFFCQNIKEFSGLFCTRFHTIACDLHPDYLSTRYAEESGFDLIYIQHHHAHIASCMAENGLTGAVIGISYDGTGLGTDGNIWGSEVFIADYKNFKRISHFEYIPLPGGDKSVTEPWRTSLSYIFHALGNDLYNLKIPFFQIIKEDKVNLLIEAIEKNINCPLSCSAGRLFDAVSALLCICIKSNYHAEAPMILENYINPNFTDHYSYSGYEIISFKKMIKEIISDIQMNISLDEIITKFHNTIAQTACSQAEYARSSSNLNTVAISGGCFQNKYLTEKLLHLLNNKGFNVFAPQQVPINDGGIALGQLIIAAHKTNKNVPGDTCKNN